jgi:hypothetical protein
MIVQAFEYEKDQTLYPSLQKFYDSTTDAFRHPQLQALAAELHRRRALLKKMST